MFWPPLWVWPSLWAQSDPLQDARLVECDEVCRPEENCQGQHAANPLEADHLEGVQVVLVHVLLLVHKLEPVEKLNYGNKFLFVASSIILAKDFQRDKKRMFLILWPFTHWILFRHTSPTIVIPAPIKVRQVLPQELSSSSSAYSSGKDMWEPQYWRPVSAVKFDICSTHPRCQS